MIMIFLLVIFIYYFIYLFYYYNSYFPRGPMVLCWLNIVNLKVCIWVYVFVTRWDEVHSELTHVKQFFY